LVTARGTDWGLAALVASLIATGVLTLFAGGSGDKWVYASHDAFGVAIALLLIVKTRRVWSRLVFPARWDKRTIAGVLGIVLRRPRLAPGSCGPTVSRLSSLVTACCHGTMRSGSGSRWSSGRTCSCVQGRCGDATLRTAGSF
jgi:hypothetical protein